MVTLSGVSKSRGGRRILDNFELSVAPGQFVSILGPSGVGKSTILDLIAGFLDLDSGRIEIDGVDVTRVPANRRGIGFIFQDFALFPHLSVEENIRFPLDARRVPASESTPQVLAALKMVGLDEFSKRAPAQLSGGQRQRVAIARALVSRPPLLLMDEPLSSLDPGLRDEMMREVRDLQRRTRVTVICVTHDLGEALAMSDRVAVLGRGHIVQIGTPDEIHNQPVCPYVARLVGPVNIASVAAADPDPVGQRLRAAVAETAARGATDAIGVRPYRVGIRPEPPAGNHELALEGNIVEVKLTGTGFAYTVDVADARPWRVVSSHAFDGAVTGARVWLTWEKAHTMLMRSDSALGL